MTHLKFIVTPSTLQGQVTIQYATTPSCQSNGSKESAITPLVTEELKGLPDTYPFGL